MENSQQLKLVKMKVGSLSNSLGTASSGDKGKHVSHQMADHFNGLIDLVTAVTPPEWMAAVPPRIEKDGHFAVMGITGTTFFELEVYLNEITDLLANLESE